MNQRNPLHDTRALVLSLWLEDAGQGAKARLAEHLRRYPSYVSDLQSGQKPITDDRAGQIEAALGRPAGSLAEAARAVSASIAETPAHWSGLVPRDRWMRLAAEASCE